MIKELTAEVIRMTEDLRKLTPQKKQQKVAGMGRSSYTDDLSLTEE
jgi:hypothetical protein